MQYLSIYSNFFRHPRWGMNLLFGGVCFLIPMIGPIVWLGYLIDCLGQSSSDTAAPTGEPFPGCSSNS